MSNNTKRTSRSVASLASHTLLNNSSSQIAKQLAASALAQHRTGSQTGAQMEELAGRVLASDKYADATRVLAASLVSQSNKDR